MYEKAENTAKAFPTKLIARYKNPSVELVLECMSKSKPIIITDVVNAWNHTNYDFKYLKNKFGDVVLTTINNRKLLLGKYIQAILDSTCKSTGGMKLPNELRDEISLPIKFKQLKIANPSIFLGTVGGITPLHRDAGNSLNLQIIGKKKWTLLSPDKSKLLAPRFTDAISGFQVCDVNLANPNFRKYLLIHKIKPLNVVIYPQEVLLVPSGWFHEVKSLEATFSVSFPVFAKLDF